jgi:hypothetical protein
VWCNGGCRYSVTHTSSAKVSFILWKVLQEASSRWIYTPQVLSACYQETIVNIREEIGDSYIWVGVDETTDVLGRFVANLTIGKLDPEAPSKSFLIFTKCWNTQITQQLHDLWTMNWKCCGLRCTGGNNGEVPRGSLCIEISM